MPTCRIFALSRRPVATAEANQLLRTRSSARTVAQRPGQQVPDGPSLAFVDSHGSRAQALGATLHLGLASQPGDPVSSGVSTERVLAR